MKRVAMKYADLVFSSTGILTICLGSIFEIVTFGTFVHELSHGMVCLLFGIPYSFSLFTIVWTGSQDPLVNTLILLAGGIGQALSSLLFFWLITKIEKNLSISYERESPKPSIFFSLKLISLTISFYGIINGIWEGLFYQSYLLIWGNSLVWIFIFLICTVLSFCVLCVHAKRKLENM